MARPKNAAALALQMSTDDASTEQLPRKGLQLRSAMRALLAELQPGDLFPSERVLAKRFSAARMTVRDQVDELVRANRLVRLPGRGTFVTSPGLVRSDRLSSFSSEMLERGMTPCSRVLAKRRAPASAGLAAVLELQPGDPVYRINRVRLADGEPMAVERVVLPAERFPGLLEVDLAEQSLYQLLAVRYRTQVQSAEQTVRIVRATAQDAALLGLDAGAPTLHLERITRDNMGRVVEKGVSLYRGDRYEIRMHVGLSGPATAR